MGRGIACDVVGEPLRYFKRKNTPIGARPPIGTHPTVRRACGADTRHRESPQTNFARNLTRSFFEIAHKRCNSNDANSIFEPVGAELRAKLLSDERDNSNPVPPTGASSSPARQHNTRPRPVSRPRPRHAHAAALSEAPPIRRSCPRDPRPRRGQPRGGQRGRGTASRTRSPGPRRGRSGSTPGRHRARRTRRA